ncbi:uncharacterized protein LOC143047573 [Mytilus galloprovincialis]|uniref:uncharacterized protein LOC143047573 n=1 Tax=Mytilus galloprovincialis TaxID=29158 RepID=UPI003F7C8E02
MDTLSYFLIITDFIWFTKYSLNFPFVSVRPTVIVHHKNYTTQLEKAMRIILKVESYPEPSASWAKSAGGKLGVWKVSKYDDFQLFNTCNSTFYLESSIKPTNEEHFGFYMVAIRNDIGSIELPVQLHVKSILEYNVSVETGREKCIASSSVNITCSSLNVDNNTVDVKWKHYFHDELVQTFQGKSMLDISHCDYRDEGDYVCEWMSNGTRLSARSSLVIIGPPVIAQQIISIQDEFVCISVDFYCEGGAIEITWYMNDVRLDLNSTDHLIAIKASNISVKVHRHTINITGFIATLVFNRNQIPNIKKINCYMRKHSYSSEVVVSKEELLEPMYISIANRTDTNIYQNVANVTFSSKHFEKSRSTLYIFVPLTTVFLLILVFGVGYRMWRSNKGLEKVLQQMEMQNSGHVNIPVQMRALIIATEDHYDEISSEIGNTYNPAVEWNNTVTVIDSDD